jgi:hypothetical protein
MIIIQMPIHHQVVNNMTVKFFENCTQYNLSKDFFENAMKKINQQERK